MSGAWNSARKHSTDGLRAAAGLPHSISYPSTKFGVDLPNSIYSDGTLIYENTILTKISGDAHVLARSTSTLVVIIVAAGGMLGA